MGFNVLRLQYVVRFFPSIHNCYCFVVTGMPLLMTLNLFLASCNRLAASHRQGQLF
ncbi:hypothetical protein DET47_1022 [Shewanella putrefaciens]|nr:hypothetical protein DET47_1022 [Shewanella putrefaciens]